MAEERLLFVRKSSGLTRAISPFQSIFNGFPQNYLPWHYFLMANLGYWIPGINLPLIYLMGGLIVLVECFSMALCYVVTPRSGSMYVPMSRGVSPMLGVLEATRSFVTNPLARAGIAFAGAQGIAALITVVGTVANLPGLIATGTAITANVWSLIGIALLFNVMGLIVDGLGPKILGPWNTVFGIGVLFGIILVNGVLLTTPAAAVPSRWDTTFGSGAYNEIVTLATENGFAPAPFSWGAMGAAFLFPVTNTWPYVIMPITGEVQQPRKSIPFSMVGGAFIVLFFNSLTAFNLTNTFGDFTNMYIFVTTTPAIAGQLKINPVVPVDVASITSGLAGGSPLLTGITAWSPQWGNFADVTLNCAYTSRPLFALAMDRMGPEVFAKIHPRWRSPYFGSIWWFIISLITLLVFSTGPGLALMGVIMGITWVYSFARLFQHWIEIELPFSQPEMWKSGLALTVGGFPVMTLTGTFSMAIFLYGLSTSPPQAMTSGLVMAIIYAAGGLLFGYYAWKNLKRGISPKEICGKLYPE